MIDIDDLHPKQCQMSKAVWTKAFRKPMRDLVVQYAEQRGDSAFLIMADEIDPLWWLLTKKDRDQDRARTEAVAEQWLEDRCYGLGITAEKCDTPSLSTYCEYPTTN